MTKITLAGAGDCVPVERSDATAPMPQRTLLRPTEFVDSPIGHDGKVARLARGLKLFSRSRIDHGGRRVSTESLRSRGLKSRLRRRLAAQWKGSPPRVRH